MKLNLKGTIERSMEGFNGFIGKLKMSHVIYLCTDKAVSFDEKFIVMWYDNYKRV